MGNNNHTVITDEAVEAAARTMIDASQSDGGWEALPQFITEKYRTIARTALEAAVPLLRADIQADTLEEFADFIRNPKETGLDDYTIGELSLEAKSKASSLRDKSEEELSPSLEEVAYLLTNERSVEAAAKAGCEFRLFAQWNTMSSGEQQMYKGKTAYMLSAAAPYLRGGEITKYAVEVAAKTKADLFTGEGSWEDYHPVTKAQYRKEVEASLKAALKAAE